MHVMHTFVSNGKTIVFCEGSDITPETKCKRFVAAGKEYEAIGSSVANSISDILQFGIVVRGTIDIPDGTLVGILE